MRSSGEALERCGLSPEELEAQEATELPERTALSLVNANLAMPVNAALGLNVLSDNATAAAAAVQQTPIAQGMSGASPYTLSKL